MVFETLLAQLSEKFGEAAAPVEVRVRNGTHDELTLWTTKILIADTLQQVFGVD